MNAPHPPLPPCPSSLVFLLALEAARNSLKNARLARALGDAAAAAMLQDQADWRRAFAFRAALRADAERQAK